MGLIQEEEDKRYFIQLALQGGKEHWSEQTHYIHDRDSIPFYENVCYVLALVASKHKEQAEKAQELLERLLKFQIPAPHPDEGGFPLSLHQYPSAKMCFIQRDIYFLLKMLSKHYALALGSHLTSELIHVLENFEKYLNKHSLLQEQTQEEEEVYTSKQLSQKYFPLKFFAKEGPSWEETLEQALQGDACYWNPSLMSYSGPCIEEYYTKHDSPFSLFDYLMASYHHHYPEQFRKKNLLQLQGALIPYFPEKQERCDQDIHREYKGMPFSLINRETYSWFFFRSFNPDNMQAISKGCHLFRFLWKEGDALHHLVCQSTHWKMDFYYTEEKIEIVFTHPEKEEEGSHEIELFIDRHPEIFLRVGDEKATVFFLDTPVYLHSKEKMIECLFSLEEGDGDFIGHLSFGNRPSQIDPKALKEHEAFDWRVRLRPLRRSHSLLKIKLQMRILQKSSLHACSQIQDYQELHP